MTKTAYNRPEADRLHPAFSIDAERAFFGFLTRHGSIGNPDSRDLERAERFAKRRLRVLQAWRDYVAASTGKHALLGIDAEMSDWARREHWAHRQWQRAIGIHN